MDVLADATRQAELQRRSNCPDREVLMVDWAPGSESPEMIVLRDFVLEALRSERRNIAVRRRTLPAYTVAFDFQRIQAGRVPPDRRSEREATLAEEAVGATMELRTADILLVLVSLDDARGRMAVDRWIDVVMCGDAISRSNHSANVCSFTGRRAIVAGLYRQSANRNVDCAQLEGLRERLEFLGMEPVETISFSCRRGDA